MSKQVFKLDERGTRIARQVSTVLYAITLYALMGIQLYRQFVLNQSSEEWTDIAVLISFNVIAWLGALLYLSGVVNPKVMRLRTFIIGFFGFVLVGLAFTIFKYAVLLDQTVGMSQVMEYFFTVLKISALLTALLGLIAYIGSRRVENRIS